MLTRPPSTFEQGRLGELMASSGEPLLRALFREQRAELQPAATPRRRASTQGAQFKLQLGAPARSQSGVFAAPYLATTGSTDCI